MSCLISNNANELILVSGESGGSDAVGSEIGCITPIDDCTIAIDRVSDVISEDW
jgi:hypothetical protein